jgi:eukaryotic-like serine/threonine-protein kinase
LAVAEHRTALEIRQKLADDNPAVTEFRSDLAQSYNNLGWLLSNTGQPAAAEVEYRKALVLQQKLADDNPAVAELRHTLANSRNNFGLLLADTGRPAAAEAEYRKTLAIYQKLSDDNPAIIDYSRGLTYGLINLGNLLADTGHASAAIDCFARSRDILHALVKQSPTVEDNRFGLAFSLSGLGRARRRTGDHRAAAADLRRAIALREGLAAVDAGGRYDLARNHALLAALAAEKTSGLAPAEAPAESDRAMEVLKRVVAEGYRAPRMCTEPDFDTLRRRDDFRVLLMDIAFPAEPFAGPR